VTIVERDDLPAGPDSRKGVPQGRHAHALLLAGERVLRDLFPGLMEELVEGGAQLAPMPQARWWHYGGYRLGPAAAPAVTCLSRFYLEHAVRRRLLERPGVALRRAAVTSLTSTGGQVDGVVLDAGSDPERIAATFVVDASGRGSPAPRWLESLGFPAPAVAEIHADVAYTTQLFRRTPGRVPDGTFIASLDEPARGGRAGAAFPIEGDRWIVSLVGFHGDRPPADADGFRAFVTSLPTPDLAELVDAEEPLGPIVTHRFPHSQWRHYEKLRRHPVGFVTIGDAVCSFNPAYGQGMTTAAQEAVALGECLDRVGPASPSLPSLYYRAVAKILATPWSMGAGGDFVFDKTTGPKPPMVDLLNWYGRQTVVASQHDPDVALALMKVSHLIAPASALMKPRMVVKITRAARRGPTGTPTRPQVGRGVG
jgi:2-polyprenyl-6-methoxyphenol hydroxylase-like FAD-dependent oxidoreductase